MLVASARLLVLICGFGLCFYFVGFLLLPFFFFFTDLLGLHNIIIRVAKVVIPRGRSGWSGVRLALDFLIQVPSSYKGFCNLASHVPHPLPW